MMSIQDVHVPTLSVATRQRRCVNLIASENFAPLPVLEAVGSVMVNKYSEGYPGAVGWSLRGGLPLDRFFYKTGYVNPDRLEKKCWNKKTPWLLWCFMIQMLNCRCDRFRSPLLWWQWIHWPSGASLPATSTGGLQAGSQGLTRLYPFVVSMCCLPWLPSKYCFFWYIFWVPLDFGTFWYPVHLTPKTWAVWFSRSGASTCSPSVDRQRIFTSSPPSATSTTGSWAWIFRMGVTWRAHGCPFFGWRHGIYGRRFQWQAIAL